MGCYSWRCSLASQFPARARGSLFSGALLLLGHLCRVDTTHLAPIQTLLATTALLLLVWQRLRLSALARAWVSGLTVAVAFYLMFRRTVGFHPVGIDFAYMFEWVRAEDYEKSWLAIALGVVVKRALPLVLVIAVAGSLLNERRAAQVLAFTLAAKLALLALMVTSHALWLSPLSAGASLDSERAVIPCPCARRNDWPDNRERVLYGLRVAAGAAVWVAG
jgi:hypothetical protein